jgi:hypothetical protein
MSITVSTVVITVKQTFVVSAAGWEVKCEVWIRLPPKSSILIERAAW